MCKEMDNYSRKSSHEKPFHIFSGFFSLGPRSQYNFHSFLRSQSGSDLSACAPDSDPAFFKDLSFRPEYSRSPSHTPRSESIVDWDLFRSIFFSREGKIRRPFIIFTWESLTISARNYARWQKRRQKERSFSTIFTWFVVSCEKRSAVRDKQLAIWEYVGSERPSLK